MSTWHPGDPAAGDQTTLVGADTVKHSRRPSTFSSTASACDLGADGARLLSVLHLDSHADVVVPAGSCVRRSAAMLAASHRAIRRGVPSTATLPEPRASAVSGGFNDEAGLAA